MPVYQHTKLRATVSSGGLPTRGGIQRRGWPTNTGLRFERNAVRLWQGQCLLRRTRRRAIPGA